MGTSSIIVRIAGLDDLDDVTGLYRANLESHGERSGDAVKPNYDWREEAQLRLARDSSRFLVAYVDGKAAGLVAIHNPRWRKKGLLDRIRRRFVRVPSGAFKTPRTGSITDLFVYPAFRRRGVARSLINSAVEALSEAGIERVYADVGIFNKVSVSAFETCGFETVQKRLMYHI